MPPLTTHTHTHFQLHVRHVPHLELLRLLLAAGWLPRLLETAWGLPSITKLKTVYIESVKTSSAIANVKMWACPSHGQINK